MYKQYQKYLTSMALKIEVDHCNRCRINNINWIIWLWKSSYKDVNTHACIAGSLADYFK
jgi:hypothetical protein